MKKVIYPIVKKNCFDDANKLKHYHGSISQNTLNGTIILETKFKMWDFILFEHQG